MGILSFQNALLMANPHLETASGAIATFNTNFKAPLKSLKVNIEHVQSGSGDPSPTNIRPITGWTGCEVWHTGANLLNPTEFVRRGGYSKPDVSVNGDTISVTNYTSSARFIAFVIPVVVGETYTIKAESISSMANGVVFFSDTKPTSWANGTVGSIDYTKKITVTATAPWMGIGINKQADYSITKFMVNAGSDALPWQPYQGTTYPISWETEAGTVFGGTLDAISGILVVDMAFVSLTGDESFTMTGNYFVTVVNNTPYACINDDAVCSHLVENSRITSSNSQIGFRVYNRSGSGFGNKPTLLIRFDKNQTATEFKNYLIEQYENGTPVTAVYKLNPEYAATFQLTPEQVSAVKGENNIWADTGDVEIRYWKH